MLCVNVVGEWYDADATLLGLLSLARLKNDAFYTHALSKSNHSFILCILHQSKYIQNQNETHSYTRTTNIFRPTKTSLVPLFFLLFSFFWLIWLDKEQICKNFDHTCVHCGLNANIYVYPFLISTTNSITNKITTSTLCILKPDERNPRKGIHLHIEVLFAPAIKKPKRANTFCLLSILVLLLLCIDINGQINTTK